MAGVPRRFQAITCLTLRIRRRCSKAPFGCSVASRCAFCDMWTLTQRTATDSAKPAGPICEEAKVARHLSCSTWAFEHQPSRHGKRCCRCYKYEVTNPVSFRNAHFWRRDETVTLTLTRIVIALSVRQAGLLFPRLALPCCLPASLASRAAKMKRRRTIPQRRLL